MDKEQAHKEEIERQAVAMAQGIISRLVANAREPLDELAQQIKIKRPNKFNLNYPGRDMAWYYCFNSGNGGITQDECIIAGPSDSEKMADEWDDRLDAYFDPHPDCRGWVYIKLDGHSTMRDELNEKNKEISELRKKLAQKQKTIKALEAQL